MTFLEEKIEEISQTIRRKEAELKRTLAQSSDDYFRQKFVFDTQKEPPSFDGTSSFEQFVIQFEAVSKINSWSEAEMALQLVACLKGDAAGILEILKESQRSTYSGLMKALGNRFHSEHEAILHRTTLRFRTRQPEESLNELADSVEKLVRKAHPTLSKDIWSRISIASFIESLCDEQIQWAVVKSNPSNMSDAVAAALQTESFLKARRMRQTLSPYVGTQQEKNSHQSGKCSVCGRHGHFRRDCRGK